VITSRLICGYATVFGQIAASGVFWTSRMFADWLHSPIVALPLRVDHRVIAVDPRGFVILNVGAARKFAVTTEPINGLPTLAEVDTGRWGDALLRDVEHHQDQEWLPPYGFSLGCDVVPGEAVLPYEVSLTTKPAFSDARVLGVGEEALAIWELLTEAPALAEVGE